MRPPGPGTGPVPTAAQLARVRETRRAIEELVVAAAENAELDHALVERVLLLESRVGEFAHKRSSASHPEHEIP